MKTLITNIYLIKITFNVFYLFAIANIPAPVCLRSLVSSSSNVGLLNITKRTLNLAVR